MDEDTRIAIHRLLVLAMDETDCSPAAANFLLAWWNAPALGGLDLTDLTRLDPQSVLDACRVLTFIAGRPDDPLAVFDPAEIEAVIRRWRPNR